MNYKREECVIIRARRFVVSCLQLRVAASGEVRS